MFFGLFVWTQGNSQCYIQLGDYSGFDTSPYLDTLEAAACDLIRSLPSEFQNQFRVYDFGFYRLNEYMEEGVDKIWQEMIRQVEQMTPYYLIFGKESSTQGIYSTIRVAVKLPLAESFGCPLKTNAGLIESDLVNLLNSNDNPYAYAKKEIDAMKYLKWEEILAQFDKQNCDLLYSRLEALGFEAREVKIVEPVQAIAPRSRTSATCNVVDHTDFRVEWYEETRTPASILCSELAEMEGVTQGFIYASDDICTEADLAEVEALINDETLLHVYLKPCGGEEFGVLMERGAQDPTDIAAIGEAYNYYFDYNGSMLLKEAIPLPMLPGKVFVRKNDIDKCPWPSLCSNMPLVTRYDEVQSLLFQIFFIFSETLKLTMPIFGKEQVLITIYLNLTIFEQKLMKKP